MRISIVTNEVFDGWEPTDTRLGGTEESVVRWSEELVKKGHMVSVFTNIRLAPDEGTREINGIWYHRRQHWNKTRTLPQVWINIKSPDIKPIDNVPMLYLTNETNASDLDLSAYDGVIWPSQWAVDNIPVNNPKTYILPHGYDSSAIKPGNKIVKQCLYASSPDRGLDVLLEAWPKIHQAHPDATLIVTYGATPQMDGVIGLGEVDEDMMNELFRCSEFWLHPCTGGELFGITGIKAQVAGCWPVYVPTMALAETVKFGTKSTFDTFADDCIKALGELHDIPTFHYPDWVESTNILLGIIEKTLKK